MENFNLKKFLVENKLTTNSRLLKEEQESVGLLQVLTNYGEDYVSLEDFNQAGEEEMYSEFMGLDSEYDSVEDMLDAVNQYNEDAGRDDEIVAIKSTAGDFNT
jgi:hypothetical protein